MSEIKEKHLLDRRTFLKYCGAAGAATLVGPQILIRKATAAGSKEIVFVSEESNPKAIKVYEKINADFRKKTGIKVVMEYPGFKNIAARVATLIGSGTPPEIVWYGAGQAMNMALEGQLADVSDVIKEIGGISDNLRMIVDGADRSIPTSQQFTYCWYRSDLYEKHGLKPAASWEDFMHIAKTLNNPPQIYGCIIPSDKLSASHLLLETEFMTNDAHWFKYDPKTKKYSVGLDEGDNKKRVIETLDYLYELHQYSPEASTYDWTELMTTFVSEKVANSYYVGSRLLSQVIANNSRIADVTKPTAFPPHKTDKYYLSIQGFHINKNSNVDAAKEYCKFFLRHPDYMQWLHSVPLHIIPASRSVLHSAKYQDNPFIQKHMDVLHFLDSIWGKGSPPYYWDGPILNPLAGICEDINLGGWMLALRNIKKVKSEEIVEQAAETLRKKIKAAA